MQNEAPAWYTNRSRTAGELYYVHDATGENQFEPSEVPSGWSIGISTTTGYVCYVNAALRPTVCVPAGCERARAQFNRSKLIVVAVYHDAYCQVCTV
jgi:hypothetical protein